MKNFKRIISTVIIGMIMVCMVGCDAKNVDTNTKITVNNSEKEATMLDGGIIYFNEEALRLIACYNDNVRLKEFTPTHVMYISKTTSGGYTYFAELIGPNGYNCLYDEEGYIYEAVTNAIVYDFR